MAYKFGMDTLLYGEYRGATLGEHRDFKNTVDGIVRKSQNIVCVGWRPDTGYVLYDGLKHLDKRVNIIEAYRPNVYAWKDNSNCKIHHKDVTHFDEFLSPEYMELCIWQDGPEHLSAMAACYVLTKMQKCFKYIIISTPLGIYPQGVWRGNPYEEHKSTWYPRDADVPVDFPNSSYLTYESMGFDSVVYETNGAGKGIMGYWKNENTIY